MFPNDSISLFHSITGNTSYNFVTGTAPKTILAVAMQQSKDLSDTILYCGTTPIAKNYAKDLPQILMNYQCANTISISKTGMDESSVNITYVPYFTSDFSTTTPVDQLGFNPTTTIASSTDVQLYGFFTAGDVVISILLILVIGLMLLRNMALALSPIKTKKKVLQYGGGDVEMREDN